MMYLDSLGCNVDLYVMICLKYYIGIEYIIAGLMMGLLALSVGHRLYIDFSVSRANFLTTLRSHLDITCSCLFWSSLFVYLVN